MISRPRPQRTVQPSPVHAHTADQPNRVPVEVLAERYAGERLFPNAKPQRPCIACGRETSRMRAGRCSKCYDRLRWTATKQEAQQHA